MIVNIEDVISENFVQVVSRYQSLVIYSKMSLDAKLLDDIR